MKKKSIITKIGITLAIIALCFALLGKGITIFFEKSNTGNIEMPNIVGMTQSEGMDILQSNNIWAETATKYDSSQEIGIILSTSVTPGIYISEDTIITVYVNQKE